MHPTASGPDPLARYLDEIRAYPLLTAHEEVRLVRRAAAGDRSARHRLVECNLRLVVSIARRYRGHGLDLLDLVQEGNVGLMAAAERYDGRAGVRFATYATWPIRREICRALSTRSRPIRVPVRMAEARGKVKRAEQALLQRGGRRPSCDDVAREAGVDADTVAVIRRSDIALVPLSEPRAGATVPLEQLLSDEGGGDPARIVAGRPDTAGAAAALAGLDGRARRILELRYGMDGGPSRTLAEVAGELGVSRQRVGRLERAALAALARRPELRAAA